MGVHRVTSEAARAYVKREKVLGSAISVLGKASTKLEKLDKETLEKCGDLACGLLPHAPGYAGKLMLVIARLFWSAANIPEKEGGTSPIEEIESQVSWLDKAVG